MDANEGIGSTTSSLRRLNGVEDDVIKSIAQNAGLRISNAVIEKLIECRKTLKMAKEENETLKKEVEKLTNDLVKFTKRKTTIDLLLGHQRLHAEENGLGC